MSVDVYREVTDKIMAALENGTVPWRKPWTDAGGERNLNSGRPYRGINSLLLSLSPYASPFWATFKGIQKKGGKVNKGEKATLVTFWKMLRVKDSDAEGGVKTIPLLRYYRVFNLEQTSGIEMPEPEERPEFEPIGKAQEIIDGMQNAPPITFGGGSAYYAPKLDKVNLPPQDSFDKPEGFYATAFHELAHATGHTSRLNRPEVMTVERFGSANYSREELVAEIGASMLCGMAGIAPNVIDNASAYIAGWLKVLADDPKVIVGAAGKAQKAADYILGVTFEDAAKDAS